MWPTKTFYSSIPKYASALASAWLGMLHIHRNINIHINVYIFVRESFLQNQNLKLNFFILNNRNIFNETFK
jgi:hypothetical protein